MANYCPNCGTRVRAGDRYCPECRQTLPASEGGTVVTCGRCKGSGKQCDYYPFLWRSGSADDNICPACRGTGKVRV